MPTADDLRRILSVTTTPEEVAFLYDQLTSPDWIPAMRELGLFADPPNPIEEGGGVMFPAWAVSRYLVRVAPKDPDGVTAVLTEIADARNPRIWWDVVDALLQMPAASALPFLSHIVRWVHHPYRLGLDASAARLAHRLVDAGEKVAALTLARSLAQLVAPAGWPDSEPWVVLDDYEYGEEVPNLGRAIARFGSDGLEVLVDELARFLEARHPSEPGKSVYDYSFIWRPAIEDHEQNWDHDREAKLVVAIRDCALEVVGADQALLPAVVDSLLANRWPVIKRLGIHLLVVYGADAPDLVGRVVADEGLLADDQLRHELYRLVVTRFAELPAETQRRYFEAVEAVAPTRAAGLEASEAELLPKVFVRRWLGAVAAHLPGDVRARYEAVALEVGEDPHPDFPSYHMSWMGTQSPLSASELKDLGPENLLSYLSSWQPPQGVFGPAPSRDGLAGVLAEAAKEDPAGFARTAPAYAGLHPEYARGLLDGLREAVRGDRPFDWGPVLELCQTIVDQPADRQPVEDAEADNRWGSVRINVARLLETGLEERTSQIPLELRDHVWRVMTVLAEDVDPTPESESRFGPPNMDPVTYSLNTVRGIAFHGAFTYLLWQRRLSGEPAGWTIAGDVPEVGEVLDEHLEPGRDTSVAIRAVYGWWLPQLVFLDPAWVLGHLERLFNDLADEASLAAWHAYVAHGVGSRAAYEVLAPAYERYAGLLAGMADKPGREAAMTNPDERFIDHLVRLWVSGILPREGGPLATLVRSGRTWLVSGVVEEAGRLINRSTDVSPEIMEAFHDLWVHIRRAAEETDPDVAKASLGGFAWWFDSPLPAAWTLPELVELLTLGVRMDPEFTVFKQLAAAAPAQSALALQALEAITGDVTQGWVLRAHEKEISVVLETCLRGTDGVLRARAEVLVHKLGRAGLLALGDLLREG